MGIKMFYVGIAFFVLSIVCTIYGAILEHREKRKLNEYLKQQY